MNRYLAGASAAAFALMAVSTAHAAFPPVGADTLGPGITITYAANGSISTSASGQGPYDKIEDSYVGVVNNSGHVIKLINLSSTLNIGGFEGDGIESSGYLNNPYVGDTTGYGGPDGFFTNNLGTSLTINFANGIASGSTDYFSLEQAVSLSQLSVPEPATWALMLIGIGGVGYAARRRAAKAAVAI